MAIPLAIEIADPRIGIEPIKLTFLSNVLFGIMTQLDTTGPTLSTVKVLRVILDTIWCSKSTSKVLRVPSPKDF